MSLAKLNINVIDSTRLHVEITKNSGISWLNIHGWVAGTRGDKVSVTNSWRTGECLKLVDILVKLQKTRNLFLTPMLRVPN